MLESQRRSMYQLSSSCRWVGRVHWGIAPTPSLRFSSVESAPTTKDAPKVVVSMNEVKELHGPLTSQGYDVVEAGGAGYKILSVVLGLADLYVTAKPSTYKWDSCAGHAILVIFLNYYIFNSNFINFELILYSKITLIFRC